GGAIGTDRQAVGAAAQFSDDSNAAIRGNAGQRAAFNFDEQNRSVGHRDRAFGKPKAGRNGLGRAVVAHADLGRGALRKSAASKPSGAAISTIGSSRASNSIRSARVMTACMS